MTNIFLSYANEDHLLAEKLKETLELYPGISVVRDKDYLLAGDDWKVRLSDAILNSDYFMPLISSHYAEPGRYSLVELDYAILLIEKGEKGDKFIVPISINQSHSKVETLTRRHAIEYVSEPRKMLDKILSSINLYDKIAAHDANSKIRLTAHIARFEKSERLLYFVNVCNISNFPISLTHVHYVDPFNSVALETRNRPLPVRLERQEPWVTFTYVDKLPEEFQKHAFENFVVRLGSGEAYRSIKEDSILPRGSVPGGDIILDEFGEDPTA